MDIDGIIGKVTSNADKIGMLGGAWATLGKKTDLGADPITAGMTMVNALFRNPHIPNFDSVFQALTSGAESEVFMPAVKAAVIGYILKELNLHPTLNKIGNFAQDAGTGAAKSAALLAALLFSGYYASPGHPEYNIGGNSQPTQAQFEKWVQTQ